MSDKSRCCVLIAYLLFVGCARDEATTDEHVKTSTKAVVLDSDWDERNADIYRYLLSQLEAPPQDRIYFITTTPMSEWGETGTWKALPADEVKLFSNSARYRNADEAYLKEFSVFDKGSHHEAWMKWISVKRWINDTKVEVEIGIWCCPMGGGASTAIYEKVDDKWKFKDRVSGWIS